MFQVSPAKLALRRHLSQERLTSHLTTTERSTIEGRQTTHDGRIAGGTGAAGGGASGGGGGGSSGGILGTRTIGDLVSGEIERTLEISNQTIINAAVDMSVMARAEAVYSPISRPASAEGDTGLATLAHVASYAPTPTPTTSSTAIAATRSSVLYTPTTQPQR